MTRGDGHGRGLVRARPLIVALSLAICLGSGERRAIADPPAARHSIRYAAKTEIGSATPSNADYFSLVEDEQSFVVTNGSGPAGPAASKHAAEAFHAFYAMTSDPEATWPHRFDSSLSYIENRLVAGLRWANTQLHAASRERATAVAAVISGDRLTVGHVGNDRAYLIRGDQIRRLTQDHTMLEEYRRDHPTATPDELDRVPRKAVVTRALGRRPSVGVDVATIDLVANDRIVLCSEGLTAALDDGEILDIVRARGVAIADLEATVAALVGRAGQVGSSDVTVMLLALVNKQP
jgi:protein phosphatase